MLRAAARSSTWPSGGRLRQPERSHAPSSARWSAAHALAATGRGRPKRPWTNRRARHRANTNRTRSSRRRSASATSGHWCTHGTQAGVGRHGEPFTGRTPGRSGRDRRTGAGSLRCPERTRRVASVACGACQCLDVGLRVVERNGWRFDAESPPSTRSTPRRRRAPSLMVMGQTGQPSSVSTVITLRGAACEACASCRAAGASSGPSPYRSFGRTRARRLGKPNAIERAQSPPRTPTGRPFSILGCYQIDPEYPVGAGRRRDAPGMSLAGDDAASRSSICKLNGCLGSARCVSLSDPHRR